MAKNEDTPIPDTKEKKQESGYVNWWLFRNKGTVAEPWPTAEELWKDKDVQNEIEEVTKAFNYVKEKKNN